MKTALRTSFAAALALICAGLLLPVSGKSQGASGNLSGEPVLLELFTSQGCSSCPPADALAARVARENGLVVLSRPVDYWDRLGWKDTLARPENTALQQAYARRGLGGYNGVYTPQIVIAGQTGEVGSNERAIRKTLVEASRKQAAAIRVRAIAKGGYGVGFSGALAGSAEVMLVGVARHRSVAIRRGENSGREIGYTNVVIAERRIATWSGGPSNLRLEPSQLAVKGADRYAVVIRMPDGGPVLAAQWLA